jgi:hypothetical protein
MYQHVSKNTGGRDNDLDAQYVKLETSLRTRPGKVVAPLLEHGADPTFRDIDGLTALEAVLALARTGPGARRQDVTDRQATAALLSTALSE